MKTLYKNLKLVYPGHHLNGTTLSVLVEKGKILETGIISNDLADQVVSAKDLTIFPALIDMQCSVGEPGFEYKETFESIAKCAKAGGFNTIVVLPTTSPAIDNKAQLEYIEKRSARHKVEIKAYGSITKGARGTDLSEMYDMHTHGAVAFSDGKRAISDVNLMKRALEYAKNFNGTICSFPFDERLNPGGMVHESEHNTALGLKSTPSLAEEMILNRDLELLKYTQSKLHISTISTAGSVKRIKQARAEKLNLTVGVALANLIFTDQNLKDFDTNYKTLPMLREKGDVIALIDGIKSGEIDVIVTDHTPENVENKDREFDYADYGMTMLETALSLVNMKLCPQMNWETIITALAINPRKIIGLDLPKFQKGEAFDFVIFDPHLEWTYDSKSCNSLSQNSPVFGQRLRGKVIS